VATKEKKGQVIDSLQEVISRCSVGVLTDYRGLTAAEMTALRRQLREAGVEYRVVKNTLARFAAERAGRNELVGFFEGPVAIAFGYDDITEPAKALAAYMQATKLEIAVKGGFLADRLLSAAEVDSLSKLPSRDVLLARVVGGIQSPISALLNRLAAPMTGLVVVLKSRIEQLEGE
jgi:large subunit ribosomal protein L10